MTQTPLHKRDPFAYALWCCDLHALQALRRMTRCPLDLDYPAYYAATNNKSDLVAMLSLWLRPKGCTPEEVRLLLEPFAHRGALRLGNRWGPEDFAPDIPPHLLPRLRELAAPLR